MAPRPRDRPSKHYEKNVTTGEVTTYYHFGGKLVALRKGTALEYVHQEHLGGTAHTGPGREAAISSIAICCELSKTGSKNRAI